MDHHDDLSPFDPRRHPLELPLRPPPAPRPPTIDDVLASPEWWGEHMRSIAAAAGGPDALAELSEHPAPFYRFDPDDLDHQIDAGVRTHIGNAGDVLTSAMTRLISDEELSVCHRLLAKVASLGEECLREPAPKLAAMVAWAALSGNAVVGRKRDQLSGSLVWHRFGVSPVADRARRLVRHLYPDASAGRLWGSSSGSVWLPDPEVLTGRTRGVIILQRDACLRGYSNERQRAWENSPLQWTDAGMTIRGRRVRPLWARRQVTVDGSEGVLVALDDITQLDSKGEVVVLTPVEAMRLLLMLENAVDDAA